MRWYFAYGSNMARTQMDARCPDNRHLGPASLPGYRWIITTRGYANLVPAPGETVEGVLYAISDSDEAALDRFEGVAAGNYRKVLLAVIHQGQAGQALVYIDPIVDQGLPKEEYRVRINTALAQATLPEAYVAQQIRPYIPPA